MDFEKIFTSVFARARHNNPITSFEAADQAKDLANHHANLILECLIKHGPLSKDGIANHLKITGHQVSRRLSELQKDGYIQPTGNTVKSNSGRKEREWQIVLTQKNLL